MCPVCADSWSGVPVYLPRRADPGPRRVEEIPPDGHYLCRLWVTHFHGCTHTSRKHTVTWLSVSVSAPALQVQSKFLTTCQKENWPPVASIWVELLSVGLHLWWVWIYIMLPHMMYTHRTLTWCSPLGRPEWRSTGDGLWGWCGPVTGGVQPSEAGCAQRALPQRRCQAEPQTGLQTP